MSSQPTNAEIEAFTGNVKHMITLQDRMREIAASARDQRTPIKEAFEEVQSNIIEFMKSGDINVCNYQDEKLELQLVSRTGSLTRKSLEAGLLSFFGGDESRAASCLEHVIQSLGTRELDVLKRVKKRKPRKRKAPTNGAPPPPEKRSSPIPPPVSTDVANEEVPEYDESSDDEL